MEIPDTPIEEVKVSLQMPEPVCSGKYCSSKHSESDKVESYMITEQKVKELLEEIKMFIKKEIKESKQPKEPKKLKEPKDVKVITTQCKLTPYGESVVTISKQDMKEIEAERKKFRKCKSLLIDTKSPTKEEPKKHEPLKNRVKKQEKVEVVVPVVEVKEQKKRGRPKKTTSDLKTDKLKIG